VIELGPAMNEQIIYTSWHRGWGGGQVYHLVLSSLGVPRRVLKDYARWTSDPLKKSVTFKV